MSSEGRLSTGYWLSHPPPGEEIFITGISGSFPDSDSVFQLKDNLFNKVDLVSGDDRRWKMFHSDIPQRTGKINNVDKFDASFFGLSFQEAHSMDPMGRIMMERTYEAIIDAGFNPKELRNTKTGVFVGIFYSDSEKTWLYDKMHINAYGFIGCSRSMLANRVSHWLGVTGPSYAVDTACSSTLYAMEHAFKAIRNGHCDAAIVGGLNLCLDPYASLQFSKFGVLSPDGRCKSFDNSANGYARSETVGVCFLQKAKDSRRVYAQVVHAKTNCDGYKEKGINYPAGKMQKLLLSEFYEECGILPNSIEYIEAHGTGTKAGDPEELNAIDEVMCTGRSEPLFVGSVKSNLGHSEAATGICAIAKLCIAYLTGYIPPNINYKVPRKGISALEERRLKVLTEKQPWSRGLAGINNFGFGGTNAHILLKNAAKSKVNNGLPSDDVPRLVCASGRTYSAVARILDDIESRTVDIELIRLLHEIHNDNIKGHFYRGYTLLGSTPTKSVSISRSIQYFSGVRHQVCFVYSGMVQGSQWTRTAAQLMRIPVFASAIERCHKTLETKGINLKEIVSNPDPKVHDNILNSFIGIAAVQIGLTDILKILGIYPDFIIGHSVGELGCAYADGCFTTEQMILAAYSLGMTCIETSFVKGSMAVVGLGYNDIKAIIPPEIEVASHNGPGTCIISGPADHMNSFIIELIAKEISVEKIPPFDIAFHSRYIAEADPTLKKYLKQVIPVLKLRSEKWLSTSVPQALLRDHHAKMSSADYHTNSFLSPVIFEDSARLIPTDAIKIEIGPHGILQKILNESFENNSNHIPLINRTHPNIVQFLFTALGKLYEAGLNPQLANIYPTVEFPVSQATPMLAHLVEWEHNENWFTSTYKMINKISSEERAVRISVTDEENVFLLGHVIDGRQLFPATGYLVMVWEAFATMKGHLYTELSVIFENVRFQRATNIPQNGDLEFIVVIQKGSGLFEIVESKASIVTGRISVKKNVGQDYRWLPSEPESTGPNVKHLLTKDFYKVLRLRGYQYSGLFQGVLGCNVEGTRGRLAWVNEWITFLDCILQMRIINQDTRGLFVPTRIEKLSIDVNMHYDAVSKMNMRHSFEVRVYPYADVLRVSGVELRGLHTTPISKGIPLGIPVLEKNIFVPNFGKSTIKIEEILRSNIQLILENVLTYKVKGIEIVDDEYKANGIEPIMDKVADILGDLPLMQADLQVFSRDAITMPSNINIENKKVREETNVLLLIGANLLKRPEILKEALSSLRDTGFIISQETEPINMKDYSDKYDIIGIQNTGFEFVVLFRKRIGIKSTKFVKIITTDETYAWIDKVKEGLKGGKKLVIYSQDEEINGLLGLVNCLRREPGGENVRGLLIADPTAPPFSPDLEFYAKQLNMDLAINVYYEGQWGTYRHLLLGDLETIRAHHAFVKTVTVGDLSSQKWLEGPIKENQLLRNPNNVLINVYCAALNFRDVMYAMGRVTVDAVAHGRLAQECIQGIEVVGRTINGTRVMALVKHSGIANIVEVDRSLIWCIPDEWTFEEAASIPVAYATAYFALVMIGNIQKGESILIHAGSGAVGQAAINVALHYGLEVFTTVGTQEKRDFIKKLYPQIKDSHIGNSRDTSFEGMIKEQTNGKGVDLVLNSLSDDKLQASVRCLGYRGRFLEIGKFDISNNTPIDMNFFINEISFHGILLDYILDGTFNGEEFSKNLRHLLSSGIESGAVRPLTYCTFEKDQIETAFRYMAAGKHYGKILFKIRDDDHIDNTPSTKLPTLDIQAVPRYMCHPDLVYVVVGGLGGFGLELTDWLIMRDARKVLLTSRKGVSNGYQSSRLRTWAGYGADVRISTHDITTEKDCEEMLKMANTMGTVEAIFNLAVVLKDCIFENQTSETFRTSFAPKGLITMNLDKISQKLCTKAGDPEELNAIDEVICTGRSEPLFVGSVKSNLGHSEAATGICAIAKLCIAYLTGYIPPNINYKPWSRGLAGINNFGFGGTNAHILLKNAAKSKVNNGLPSDDVPRLVCASGRTYSAVARILDDIESRTVDIELIRLLHEIHNDNIKGHFYRGYTLLGSTPTKSVSISRSIQYFSGVRHQVCFVYSGMVQGSQWTRIATQLMRIPVFASAIERCHKTLETKGINLKEIVSNPDPKVHDNILNSFIGIAAVQIGLTDILKILGIYPDFIIGHSVGELGCAYADGCFTTEQMILAAYSLGMTCIETSFVKGSMAVVGLGYNDIKAIIPPEIEVASHNGPGTCIISGPADHMNSFIIELIAKEISVEKIPPFDIAFHSRYIAEADPTLKKYLKQVIPVLKLRSEKWLSTSVPQALLRDHHAKMSSADYHTNSFLSPVIFEDSARLIPTDAIKIEIGPHGILQKILNESFENNSNHIPLINRTHPNIVQFLFTALGKLYEAGLNPQLANIYPTVEFPVSQATPMLAHLVEWEHNENWFTSTYKMINKISSEERAVRISVTDEENVFLLGHVIDGRQLFPATGYLVMVWEAFATMKGHLYTELSVIFENVRFQRATNIPQNGDLEFIVVIQKGSGLFEIVESKASIVTGRISVKKNVGQDYRWLPSEPESTGPNVKHLLTKDFYKVLRLRGYQYSGLFQGVLGCNVEGTRGRLAWVNEWITFLDCILQMRIINQDTRGLFVPTRIEKLSIDVNMHYDAVSKMNMRHSFEVRVYPYADVLRVSGVELRGLHTTPISKGIPLGIPVLEKNIFVPNFGKSTIKIEEILRSNIQLILENVLTYKVKGIEIVDDEYKANGIEPIMDKVADILGDLPLMQADLQVFSRDAITMPSNINIENKKVREETNVLLLIGANLLKRPEILKEALSSLRDTGFIISQETEPINMKDYSDKYDIIGIQNTGFEFVVLFRKRIGIKSTKFVKIITTDETYAWIDKVKEGLKGGKKLVIYSQDEEINGLLGLVNCLRREPGGENVRGLLIADPTAPPFSPDLEFYAKQLNMDLAINVYYEGQWGTYRHLLLGDLETIRTHHAFVKTVTVGDLSSQKWLEGPIKENQLLRNPNNVLINVYCAALNFRDVMYAMGRVTVDAVAHGRLAQECIQGIEVVGRTINGTRVMALVKHSGIANIVEVDRSLIWCIPDEWTFEEAASIPVAYATAYFALVMIGNIQKGESILIHAGSGAVGQAAINVALHYGLEVFTTVGTQEKRDFIKKLYPQIKDSHIGNSRDTSFEGMIKEQTNGKGVDLVLNSLSDDKLQASVRCLGYRGRFLEIGKFDISNNTPIDMNFFINEISFHGILLDFILDGTFNGEEFTKNLRHLLSSGIESGAVRPLTYCTFEKDQIETAFRYMAAGKHYGKILFKIRDDDHIDNTPSTKLPTLDIQAVPRYMCHPDLVYVVIGGLGGFGLELTDWLIMRDARKVLLTSRKGVSNGYQSSRLRTWAGYGADVRISTHDITTEKDCEEMLKMANTMGTVEAIFNLAVVLKDCIFENQTSETFRTSFAPKGLITMNLDKISQKLCPKLKDFVMFSSVSCGRGNAGQTNYGFSNSVMERICERRKKFGLPALAVQWGAIGDVGLVADMQDNDIQLEIGGTLQQRISSCLLTLDKFLRQDNVIVSSMVVAKKKASSGGDTIMDIVTQLLGIKDIKAVSQQVSLADLGMDSMMAVEIKQTFEREFEIFLTSEDIQTLTLARIMELKTQTETDTPINESVSLATQEGSVDFQVFIKNFGDEKLAVKPFIYLPTMFSVGSDNKLSDQENEMVMFILPGLEGCAAGMVNLSRRLKIKVCVLQYYSEEKDDNNLDKMIERLYKIMKERFNPRRPYILLGYSFGSLPMLKLAKILESEGHSGIVFCIDGSPDFLKTRIPAIMSIENETQLQNSLICHIINIAAPKNEVTKTLMHKLKNIKSYDERIQWAIQKVCSSRKRYSDKFIESIVKACFNRLKIALNQSEIKKIKAPIVLIRAKQNLSFLALDENYGLNKSTDGPITVHVLDNNHSTITENKECANIINTVLCAQRGGKIAQNVVRNVFKGVNEV
ncbi:unnamed protein product [Euphydryas editha]|uniref:Uncharacterized protein n=1 Tax=Euphydryas editha TaxID=104508 RepID=A0AAU9UG14_EUPED|nr:unnamed protein product [Euphydryas editha]